MLYISISPKKNKIKVELKENHIYKMWQSKIGEELLLNLKKENHVKKI